MGRIAALSIAAVMTLALAPAAFGAGDPVASGSFQLQLSASFRKQLRRAGVAIKPRLFSIKEGTVDPLTGEGNLTLAGKLRFKHGRRKVVYDKVTATLGAGGVLKGGGTKLFSLSGGGAVRDGFGAQIAGVKASLLKSAARKISRKLRLHSLHRAAAGSLRVSVQPQTVEVTGGDMHIVPDPTLTAGSGTVASKASAHCLDFVSGVTAISPGVKNPPVNTPSFDFPVTGGTISPNGTDGVIQQTGGIQLANRQSGGGVPSGCSSMPLATIQETNFANNLPHSYISAHVVVSGAVPTNGDFGVVPGTNLDDSHATVVADPVNHTVTITGSVITINGATALTLNSTFLQPMSSYDQSLDFAPGDLFATANLTVTTR